MSRAIAFLVLLAICGLIAYIAYQTAQPTTLQLTADDYGPDWPFTVPAGTLSCDPAYSDVLFTVDGTTYGLNAARARHTDPTPIIKTTELGGPVDITPLIQRGLELCQ